MASTDIEYKPDPEKKSAGKERLEGFQSFVYDKQAGTVFGRTCDSWGKIGLFYLIFYACLAAFFAAFLAGLLSLMDDQFPNQTGMNSLIKGNPGMGFRPQVEIRNTLIHYEQGNDTKKFEDYVAQIKDYLKGYSEDKVQKDAKKMGGKAVNCTNDDRDPNEACLFDVNSLGGGCTEENNFGYGEGTPCVLLKINKIYDWVPELYESKEDVPDNIAANWAEDYLTVTCEGENAPDKDLIGPVEYYPTNGFQVSKFFPYRNQPGYRPPIVFAKFTRPISGALIQVWCKIWARNIYHDKNDKAGSVHFELLID